MSSRKITGKGIRKNDNELTAQQRIFVAEYLKEWEMNGSKAAEAAGYAPGSSDVAAARLLSKPHVAVEVNRAIKERLNRIGLDSRALLKHLENALFLDPLDFFAPGEDGGYILKGDLADVPQHVRRCIKGFKTKTKTYEGRDGSSTTITTVEVTLMDKDNMQVLAMKHAGMFIEKKEISHSHSGNILVDILKAAEKSRGNIIDTDFIESQAAITDQSNVLDNVIDEAT